ncbi:hypothetical protein, partial [Dermatophilus congolensis]|uniref:hypothetical protein n=1 Tax=Dermatophilus congolensis TaxID=1863 RepID=UPI001AB049F7
MGTYDHLPSEQRHLAHDIDTILGPILRGLTGTPNTPPRHTETIPRHYRIVVATDSATPGHERGSANQCRAIPP